MQTNIYNNEYEVDSGSYVYDDSGRIVECKMGMDDIIFEYDLNDNVTSYIDYFNSDSLSITHINNIEYDEFGRVSRFKKDDDYHEYYDDIFYEYDVDSNVSRISRNWSFNSDGNLIARNTTLEYEYDEIGNPVHISVNTDSQEGDEHRRDIFGNKSINSGDIYIDYEEERISLEEFPKFFFDYFLRYKQYSDVRIYDSTGVDVRAGDKNFFKRGFFIGVVTEEYRKSIYGLVFSGNYFNYVSYDDLDLTMEDVYDYYN